MGLNTSFQTFPFMNFQQLCQKLNNVYSKLKQNKQISTGQIKQSKDKDLRTKMKNFP